MKFHEAKKQLDYILARQKTVSVNRLNDLLSVMQLIPIKETQSEVDYLKGELRKAKGDVTRMEFELRDARVKHSNLQKQIQGAKDEANKYKQRLESRRRRNGR